MLNGLDLFSGIGGISVALAPWVRPLAYCENDRFAQAILLSRMHEGRITPAPIWDDISTLLPSMLPGHEIDIIYGGFPCQDLSVAGTNKGLAGIRSGLFQHIIRLAEEIRPAFIFLENVPAISSRGLDVVLSSMSKLRYDSRWTVVSAAEVGAPHLRKRFFLLASDADRIGIRDESKRKSKGRLDVQGQGEIEPIVNGEKKSLANPQCTGLERHEFEAGQSEKPEFGRCGWWLSEPNVGRVAHGLPDRPHRIKSLGNAVVPQQAREAFIRLLYGN